MATSKKNFTVVLSHCANPDVQGGYRNGNPCAPCKKMACSSLEEAADLCLDYIEEHCLGGGNWSGGAIHDARTGKAVAEVGYNGSVWDRGFRTRLV